jgi:hypothetical protein
MEDFKRKCRIVEYFYPHKANNQNVINFCKTRVSSKKKINIYETVEIYEKIIFPRLQTTHIDISDKVPLRTLINIHNYDGIKNFPQIVDFFLKVKQGEHIVQSSGLPNIKLAKVKSKKLLVFDGHHSLLAYMAAGKVALDEIPHIIVSGDKGFLEDKEILVFWGHHARKIPTKNWEDYVINWEKPENRQICKRIQRNVGELFDALLERICLQIKDYNMK